MMGILYGFNILINSKGILLKMFLILGAIAIYYIVQRVNKGIIERCQVKPRKRLKSIITLTVLTYAVEQMFKSLYLTISSDALPKNEEIVRKIKESQTLLEQILSASIKTPIVEEIIFRGLLFIAIANFFKIFKARVNNVFINIFFCIISTMIFGMAHCINGHEMLKNMNIETDFKNITPYAVSGLLYSILYVLTKRLSTTIGVHMLNNFFGKELGVCIFMLFVVRWVGRIIEKGSKKWDGNTKIKKKV